jgi:hypothetical protein
LSVAYGILVPERVTSTNPTPNRTAARNAGCDPIAGGKANSSSTSSGGPQPTAAIYARVSSARQKKDETIGSQVVALREHAATAG